MSSRDVEEVVHSGPGVRPPSCHAYRTETEKENPGKTRETRRFWLPSVFPPGKRRPAERSPRVRRRHEHDPGRLAILKGKIKKEKTADEKEAAQETRERMGFSSGTRKYRAQGGDTRGERPTGIPGKRSITEPGEEAPGKPLCPETPHRPHNPWRPGHRKATIS